MHHHHHHHHHHSKINCNFSTLLFFLLFCVCILSKQTTEAFASEKQQGSSRSRRQRQPWDVFRFVQQSSKFVKMPSAPFVKQTTTTQTVTPGDSIWSPSSQSPSSSSLFNFSPLDDVVMGGVSSSTFDSNSGRWSGFVSEDNSGGFVGIRSTPFRKDVRLDMSGCSGIEFRLKGSNGRRIKAIVRDSSDFNGICWTSSFNIPSSTSASSPSSSKIGGDFFTSLFGGDEKKDSEKETKGSSSSGGGGGVTVIRVPFQNMIPTVFANVLDDKPKGGLNKENVMGIQLTYSKFEYNGELNAKFILGDFDLQILDVRAY